ncbi:microtubule-associated protein Jupiter isoform X8 [Plodia interpunctella]|uniref:microtubule-associated protein Jupiter isoform X8 n=1 Tax=Plodia interpunctella TaxID=58824 RepID=UPI002367D45F|nr:microtubule-associated protein Jupiter isoform X8 [Plodia interpunctella]
MSSTLIFVGLPEDSKSSISKLPSTTTSSDLQTVELEELRVPSSSAAIRVPNAPKSCIAEIFSTDSADGSPVKNGNLRPRVVRDTPTRPRDTHSRLFGQINGASPAHSPSKMTNGSQASSTPSREGNPITGDGYKSLNGQINTVTSVNGSSGSFHRVPPGGFSSGLW